MKGDTYRHILNLNHHDGALLFILRHCRGRELCVKVRGAGAGGYEGYIRGDVKS